MPRKRNVVRLAPPPIVIKSQKKEKVVSTIFHKYSQQCNEAVGRSDTKAATELGRKIKSIDGRKEYQRASQLNTSFHSTSRCVKFF